MVIELFDEEPQFLTAILTFAEATIEDPAMREVLEALGPFRSRLLVAIITKLSEKHQDHEHCLTPAERLILGF